MRDESSKATGTGTKTGPKPGWFGLHFGLNRQERELRVCMTRAVAGVSVAGFCGLLIGVVAVSRSASNNGPQSAHASPTVIEPIAKADLPRPTAPVKAAPPKPRPAQVLTSAKPIASANQPVKSPPAATATLPGKARAGAMPTTSTAPRLPDDLNKDFGSVASITPVATKPAGRTVGHNYLVFGSFPTQAEARRISKKLESGGVPVTVERGLPGWTKKTWYSVVGVKGYETTKQATYRSEVKSLEAQGLEPKAYRWRSASGA